MNRTFSFLTLVFILTGCNTNAGWTPSPDEPRAFVTTLGADTVSVEVYTRNATSIEGILVDRLPQTRIIEYAARLDADGNIVTLQFSKRTPGANPSIQNSSIAIADGRATVIREGTENPDTIVVDVPVGTVATLGYSAVSMFAFEQVAKMLKGGANQILLLGASGAAPVENASLIVSADTISMDYHGFSRIGWLDKKGQILGASGAATTNKSETRRVEPFLVGEMAERWGALDVAGAGIGTPSPGAVVAITLDNANLVVNYSQPAKRGRAIWGQLVPEGQLWRTGANAATHFTTDKDLSIDGQILAAGTYTMWSIYADGGLTLIFNSQTGQWGTVYDPALDVFSTAMIGSDRTDSSERFVISLEDTEEGGSIIFDWDMNRFTLPFTVN